jgi:integrase/recombinase XerD
MIYAIFAIMKNWQPYIQGFKAYLLLERSLSANTAEAYLADLGKLQQYLELKGIAILPQEVEPRHLEAFLQWLAELGLAARSQARLLSALKTFYRYLLLENISASDPAELIEAPRLSRKIPEVLSYEEIQAMLAAIDLSHPQGTRNRAMLEVLYACGLRVSELAHLRLSNLYLDIGFVKVVGKGDKERIVPIGQDAIKYTQLYLHGGRRQQMNVQKGHEHFLFLNRRGQALSRVMIFKIVKEITAAAGIRKNVSPHTFRHSFATHLIEGGADLKAVQDMLGHESITTTEIYTHLDLDYLREAILAYHPRNSRRGEGKGQGLR